MKKIIRFMKKAIMYTIILIIMSVIGLYLMITLIEQQLIENEETAKLLNLHLKDEPYVRD